MILGAFGDSFLHGSDLSDCPDIYWPGKGIPPSNKTWPALCAKNLNLAFECFALPGIGNSRISYTVLDAINRYSNSCFYIINWTWIERFDYFDVQSDCDASWNTLLPGHQDEKTKIYYKHFHSELYDKFKSLGAIYQTIQALNSKKCQYIMTYMDHLIFDSKFHCPNYIEFLQNEIKDCLSNFDGKNFIEWSKDNNYEISNKWHPLDEAHQAASEYWLPRITHMLNTNAKEDYQHAFK